VQSRGIDRSATLRWRCEAAVVVDEQILDLPVDPVGRVIDFAAGDSKHDRPVEGPRVARQGQYT
jgi:hypothetical protein